MLKIQYFFKNIGPNLANKIPQLSRSFDQYIFPVDTQTDLQDFTLKEFKTACKALKRNKTSGIDDINSYKVLEIFLKTSKLHDFIFRASLREGVFPDEMKIVKVNAIFKGVSNLKAENHRPISILPLFLKILEKII